MSKKKILNMNSKYDNCFELRNFKNLPKERLEDIEFIMSAVNYDGALLEYVPDKFKADKEIILIALNQNYNAYPFIAHELKIESDFIIPIIEKYPLLIDKAEENIKSNRDLVLKCIKKIGVDALWDLSPSLYEDVEIFVEALDQPFGQDCWIPICTGAGTQFEFNKTIIECAYKLYGKAVTLKYSLKDLLKNTEVMKNIS
jgi:hypothetical protein